jgi:hypothetical protein
LDQEQEVGAGDHGGDPSCLDVSTFDDFGNDGNGDDEILIHRQVYALWRKRLSVALNDPGTTVPLLGFPLAVGITGLLLNLYGVLGEPGDMASSVVMAVIIAAGYLPVVSLFTELIVRERTTALRNVLTVMGCDPVSYWVGSFCGDFTLALIPSLLLFVAALICAYTPPPVTGKYDDHFLVPLVDNGSLLWLLCLSSAHIILFCYFLSFLFTSPKIAIASTPFIVIVLLFVPPIFVALFWYGFGPKGTDLVFFADSTLILNMLRGLAVCSPQGALAVGILAAVGTCSNVSQELCVVPAYWEVIVIIIGENFLFALATYLIDQRCFLPLEEKKWELSVKEVEGLDLDVAAEREAVMDSELNFFALRLANLRKVFPAKRATERHVEAVKCLTLGLPRGEMFGLLGPNGNTVLVYCFLCQLCLGMWSFGGGDVSNNSIFVCVVGTRGREDHSHLHDRAGAVPQRGHDSH